MHRTSPRQPHPDGGNLSWSVTRRVDPYPGASRKPTGFEPEVRKHVDDQLFDTSDIRDGVGHTSTALAGNRSNRVSDQLAGPVVCDIAPAIGLDHVGTELAGVNKQVGCVGTPAECDHVGMLEQQQVIVG